MPRTPNKNPPVSTVETLWEDIGFTPEEAAVLRIKTKLHVELTKVIEQRNLTPKEVGTILDMQQPNVSNLLNGKLGRMSLDRLTKYLHRLGRTVDVITKNTRKLQTTRTS
jgi:predicted XRE-type DNA-binding protein